MRAYRLAGVPSPPATWVQWRVVTGADEVSAKDQYAGDLWGLYVALGDMEPKLLADRKLPDGLTVSIQSGIKHTPKGMADAQKVWEKFLNGMRSDPKEEWWRKNLDLPAYYSFHALNRLLGNVDLRPDGNHGYYRRPDGRWAPIPWDNDMMFVPRHHQPGTSKRSAASTTRRSRSNTATAHARSSTCSPPTAPTAAGRSGQLAADLGAALTPKKYDVDWPRLDEARWNLHPRINPKGAYFVNPASGGYAGGQLEADAGDRRLRRLPQVRGGLLHRHPAGEELRPERRRPAGLRLGLPRPRGEGRQDSRDADGGAAEGGRLHVRGVGVRLTGGPEGGGAGVAGRPRRQARLVRTGRPLAERGRGRAARWTSRRRCSRTGASTASAPAGGTPPAAAGTGARRSRSVCGDGWRRWRQMAG